MTPKAAITIGKPRSELEQAWQSSDHSRALNQLGAQIEFREAPADRGTEMHIRLPAGGRSGGIRAALAAARWMKPLAQAKDELRRFKQLVETGEITRSDATPKGERVEAKLHQRPAQPLEQRERQEVGV